MSDITNKRLIVVLGMHRSGTSAITRGLATMGVCLGDNLMPAIPGINDKGFFEDIDINALNIEIQGLLDSEWYRLKAVTEADLELLRSRGYVHRAVTLLHAMSANSLVFGLKEPRISKLLPFWNEVFAEGGFEVGYVMAIRNPLSVIHSLSKRDGFEPARSYLIWLDYVLSALTGSIGKPCVVVDFDQLMQFPRQELERVAQTFALQINPVALEEYESSFLDHRLRHSIFDISDLEKDQACLPLVIDIYSQLWDIALNRQLLTDSKFLVELESWKKEFIRIISPVNLIDALEEQLVRMRHAEAGQRNQLSSLQQAVLERDSQLESLSHTVGERDSQLESLSHTVGERDIQLAGLHQIMVERDNQIAGLHRTLNEAFSSKSWKVTKPLRFIGTHAKRPLLLWRLLPNALGKSGGYGQLFRKVLEIYRKEGFLGVRQRIRALKVSAVEASLAIPQVSMEVEHNLGVVPYYVDPRLEDIKSVAKIKASVAIHLHVSSLETLDGLVKRMENLANRFDLYVSVPTIVDEKEVARRLQSLRSVTGKLVIEQTPNRGRDIAPLIVQFGERLSHYTIVGHLHTICSNGVHAQSSLEHAFNHLLGKCCAKGGHVGHLFNLLLTEAKLIYSESRIPCDVRERSGWAGNHAIAKQLLEKFTKIDIENSQAIQFPEDSMFWARSSCLKDLLEFPLSYDDFPEEPLVADGTIVHALQRLILVLASPYDGQCLRLHTGDSIADYRHYEAQQDYSNSIVHTDIKVLAYYLPQFHPIPENDEWHGKGFTEWTKVSAANPLFQGHYQQHIPHPDIGYYLLDSPDTLRKQAELMRKSGVHGQVFYHYWFTGKLILQEPVRMLLETPDINMPYCFCWANENWTRRWDGNESEILLGQNYSAEDAKAFIRYLIPFLQDPRYIRVDGRPKIYIYRPASIPDIHLYLDIWAHECVAVGLPKPYVVAVLTRGASHPTDFGMDAGVERVLHDWTDGGAPEIKHTLIPYQQINGRVLSYNDVANFYSAQTDHKDFTYFRSLVPIWDNTARYGQQAYVVHGSSPERFQKWLESIIQYTKQTLPADRRFVLVNAWNEWAEGAHLEPDTRYGYSYLNAVGRALAAQTYDSQLNPDCVIPSELHLHIKFDEEVKRQFAAAPELCQSFFHCLAQSSILQRAIVSVDHPHYQTQLSNARLAQADEANWVLTFRRVAYFADTVLERMMQAACANPESIVIANTYDNNSALIKVDSNGAAEPADVCHAAMVLSPQEQPSRGIKCYTMRTDAQCFVVSPNTVASNALPVVTTIIRYHKSGDIALLRNALYCLKAMHNCIVVPMITAQDLNIEQTQCLNAMLAEFWWPTEYMPQVLYYTSTNGRGDLRSKMLNEALRKVKTQYAAFLDYDDLMMPHSYAWLIARLRLTGKVAAFGRVYSTLYDGSTGLRLERRRSFEYGYSFEEFVGHNNAPLHSFMLDVSKIDFSKIVYHDDQRYMEDYFLTLQLFTKDNADWKSLAQNFYIGDYIHSVDRSHTLAFDNDAERAAILTDPEYMLCEQRISDLRNTIMKRIKNG